MRHPLILLSVACAVAWAPVTRAQAQSDPSEIFLNAYMSVQQAEKLEGNGNYKAALSKYRYAGSLLDQLHDRHPDWQALIVAYRKKKTGDAIAKLEQWMALEEPATASMSGVPAPANQLNTDLLPGITDPSAGAGDAGGAAALSSPEAGRSVGGPTDLVAAAQEIRSQMAALKHQLDLSQRQLEEVRKEKATITDQLEQAVEQAKRASGEVDKLSKETEAAKAQAESATQALTAAHETEVKLKAELEQAKTGEKETPGGDSAPSDEATRQLRAELEEAKAAAADAKNQLEKAKASEGDLVAQLAAARKELEGDGTAGAGVSARVKRQISKLQEALNDARADREVAEEQGEIMARKMADLAKRPDLSGKLAEAEQRAKTISAENEKITEQLTAAQQQIETLESTGKQLAKERDAEKDKNTELTGKLADVQKTVEEKAEELAEAEKKLIAMTQERDTARTESTELTGRLEASRKEVETITGERDAATKQRDEALGELAKAAKAKEEFEKLLEEKGELVKKLDEAQATIASFNSSAPEKEKEIADLKQKLTGVQEQLVAVQQESDKSSNTIKELQAQLDLAKAQPAAEAGGNPEEVNKLTEENELLRGIVTRELKNQARREQARKLIVSELGRLQVRSKALNEQVALLGQPVIKLSEKESALFKTPQMEIIDNETNAMAISIAAPQMNANNADGAETAGVGKGGDSLREAAAKGGDAPTVETGTRPNLPDDLQPLAREAKEKFDRGQYVEAERAYEKLASKAPSSVYVLSNLGAARYRAGKLKLAEETFKKVIAIAPEDAFSYATLGIVYYKQSKYDEAVTSLTRSLAINPKNPTAHNYLGVTAAQKGWKEAAQREIETALQIDPAYADAHFNLAVVLATAQPPDKENARKHYKKAVLLGSEPDKTLEDLIR